MSVEKDCQAFATRIVRLLREERERRGLSKYAVAQESGLSQQAIGYLERGEKLPSFTTILRYAAGIGVNFAEIVRNAENEVEPKRRGQARK